MNNLAVEVTNIVNKYIDEKGLTTEDVCGVLDVVSYRVKENSTLPETELVGGGSPVSKIKTDGHVFGSPVSKDN